MLSTDAGAETASLDFDTARGLLVAACRETFEESGVLLARPRGGGPWSNERLARVAARRVATTADSAGFARMLVDEDLVLDVDRLVYWSHWITPAFESRRFDTRFFALTVPPDQVASVDRGELTHHAWFAEADIRSHLASGEMKMAPPTRATLQDLWSSHRRMAAWTRCSTQSGRESCRRSCLRGPRWATPKSKSCCPGTRTTCSTR